MDSKGGKPNCVARVIHEEPGRAIVGAAVIGLTVAGLAALALTAVCWPGLVSPWLSAHTEFFCTNTAKSPPWFLFSGLTAAPAVLLTWFWREQKRRDDQRTADANRAATQSDAHMAREAERAVAFATRFKSAAEMLAAQDVMTRVNAIHLLWDIALESSHHRETVADTLVRFFEIHSEFDTDSERPAEDLSCVATVLSRDNWSTEEWRVRGWRVGLSSRSSGLLMLANKFGLLSRADLRFANLSSAVLDGANLEYSDLSGADLSRAELRGANLVGATLRGAHMQFSDLSRARMLSAKLGDAELSGANLNSSNMSGSDMVGSHMSIASLRNAVLISANLTNAQLQGSDLSEANLRGATLVGTNLREANLHGAVLARAYMKGSVLELANFTDAELSGASLVDADLRYAILDGANLDRADFSGANVTAARRQAGDPVIDGLTDEQLSSLLDLQDAGSPLAVQVAKHETPESPQPDETG